MSQVHETQAILGLSDPETAKLLGIEPASLHDWDVSGVPTASNASVETLYQLALFLDREILRSHIAQIVHARDAWLGNRTILQVIAADGPAAIQAYLTQVYAFRDDVDAES